ncbi:MAG: transposase [Burkholderiales bacterium]
MRVSVINPAQIAQFGRAIGERNKTDRQDAKIIARFCQTQARAAWQAPTPEVRVLRDLMRRLEALLDLPRQEANRLDVAGAATQASIKAVLEVLTEQISTLKAAIAEPIDRHPGLKQQSVLLEGLASGHSIPAVGEATMATGLAELPASVRECVRKAEAFTGLAPRRVEWPEASPSGRSVQGRSMMSKQGSPRLRKALYFPGSAACRHNLVVKTFSRKGDEYQRMLQNGLTKKQAVCAAMRKLLHLIIGVLKSGKPFDPSLHNLTIT